MWEILNVRQTHSYKFLVLSLKYPLEYIVHEYLITCLCGLAGFSVILFAEVKVGPECEGSFVNAWGYLACELHRLQSFQLQLLERFQF